MSGGMTAFGSAIGVYWLIAKVLSLTFLSIVFKAGQVMEAYKDMVF